MLTPALLFPRFQAPPNARYAIIAHVVHLVNRDYLAMCEDYYDLDFMDRSVDTRPIAPELAEFFDDVLADVSTSLPSSPPCLLSWRAIRCTADIPQKLCEGMRRAESGGGGICRPRLPGHGDATKALPMLAAAPQTKGLPPLIVPSAVTMVLRVLAS